MCKSARFIVCLSVGVMLTWGADANQALALQGTNEGNGAKVEADRAPAGLLFKDGKVCVQELRFRPGDQGPNVPRPFRVVRVLEGGTMERIYPDGRTESVVYETGAVKVYEAEAPFVPRNTGKSDIVLYVVALLEQQE